MVEVLVEELQHSELALVMRELLHPPESPCERTWEDEQHSTYIVGRLGDVRERSRSRHCGGLDR